MRHSIQTVQRTISQFRMHSIRNQILAFAVLATLVPSLITAVIAYVQNRRAITEKITQELVTAGSQAAREVDVGLKEHLYNLRVFAASSEVTQNLLQGGGRTGRLGDYLSSVQARFKDYDELQVLDAQGHALASSARNSRPVTMPADWTKTMSTAGGLVGDPYRDPVSKQMAVTMGTPVDRLDGRLAGALVARATLRSLGEQLRGFATKTGQRVVLVSGDGREFADSRTGPAGDTVATLSAAAIARLVDRDGEVVSYRGPDGTDMVGSGRRILRTSWIAVAEVPTALAYEQVTRLRNVTLTVVSLLMVVVGLIAYRLGLLIGRPLDRLTGAAAKVTAGDLTVGLPEAGGGEVGYLTQVFNDMVTSLRAHRAELERLSTTDALTGLVNRRHLMATLGEESQRARRYNRGFAVLMLDVDHFKKYNDTYGHLAGDEVLRQLASVLKECTRTNDCAARYGGEEFLVVLSETPPEGAMMVAERIRERMGQQGFDGRKVTLSIGLALFPADGDNAEAIIGSADSALYEAKRAGRDRVTVFKGKVDKTKVEPDKIETQETKEREKRKK